LDKALEWAPTFLGLERIIRFNLLQMANKEIAFEHADLCDDPPQDAAEDLPHSPPPDIPAPGPGIVSNDP
jgi:hypothetical protein